jgi:hypothetical protein
MLITKSFENTANVTYRTRQYYALINKDNIKFRDTCHHLVQNLLSSTPLYRNIKIEVYRNKTLPPVFLGVKLVL